MASRIRSGHWAFNGQYTDTETSLIYLRNRYYDPATAQFITIDPAVGSTRDRYGYAHNNPLAYTDPTGLWWSKETWVKIGLGAGMVALAATGVGAADAALIAGEAAETISFAAGLTAGVTGSVSVGVDATICAKNGDKAACVGAALGTVGTSAGLVAVFGRGLRTAARVGADASGYLVGGAALAWDFANTLNEWIAGEAEECERAPSAGEILGEPVR